MKKILLVAFMPLLLMNCGITPFVFSENCGNDNITEINTTTGQELIDLKQALDSGVINQEEYDELKLKIIKRLDVPVDSTKSK